MYKKSKKNRYISMKVPRGGWAVPVTPKMKKSYFSPAIRKVGKDVFNQLTNEYIRTVNKHVTPQKAARIMERMIEAAAGGKSEKLASLLVQISKPLAPVVSGTIVRLITPTAGGISSPSNALIPSYSSDSVVQVSGQNGLYTAKEHRLSFTAGNRSGRWMRELKKTQSVSKMLISDTVADFQLTNPDRSHLSLGVGANRRDARLIDQNLFGENISFINNLFNLSGMDSTINEQQTLYGAISSVTSHMTLTSLNRYIPMYSRISLLKNKVTVNTPLQSFTDCSNFDRTIQDNGAMPRFSQMTNQLTVPSFHSSITVDPKTRGIKMADNWKNNFDVVYSKTTKLYAGDRLKFDYKHLFGSGVNLSKVYGMLKESDDFSSATGITYSLMIENWGEEVDVTSVAGTNSIKATAPVAYQLEFRKQYEGIQVDLNKDSRSLRGFDSGDYAVKAYTKQTSIPAVRRWNDSYPNLGVTYTVPVMSDATEQEGGRIT